MTCSVFISSTSEDLKEYRAAAEEAIKRAGLSPVAMEYFAASGGPPLKECLAKVTPCEVVVVIVAKRYGWVPPGQADGGVKSITWLECEHAAGQGKDLLVFLLEEDRKWPPQLPPWPMERTEAARATEALLAGKFTPELPIEIQRNMAELVNFRQWLETGGEGRTRTTFTTPEDLKLKVNQALNAWLWKNPKCQPPPPPPDEGPYREWIEQRHSQIEIQGITGAGAALTFPIQDLYIPLTTARARNDGSAAAEDHLLRDAPQSIPLTEALSHPRLVIIGDPGAGKTTFLQRMAFEWVTQQGKPFPVLIRVAELVKHVADCAVPPGGQEPEWLSHFLATQSVKNNWGLTEAFFAERLRSAGPTEAERAVVLLDGLDEAPNAQSRQMAARLFAAATSTYPHCRFVVTTRPQSYEGETLLSHFHHAKIEPLSPEAVETFLEKWCAAVHPASPDQALARRLDLSAALRARPEIRRMARTPVMLTALAVVHWSSMRMPEQRAELYDEILKWLSLQRERPGREKADRCLTLLEKLALAMQNHPAGRQKSVPLEWAAEQLAPEFGHGPPEERLKRARQFLVDETGDSGIIVVRNEALEFWHLTFQEHLAARAIAGKLDTEQVALLLPEKIYQPEWREAALLLAGVLHKQGRPKMDYLATAMLSATGKTLSQQARTAGLLGGMVSDLSPKEYQPADPQYHQLMAAVLGIFEAHKSKGVPFKRRLEAAEALAQAGDPRFSGQQRKNNWVHFPAGTFRLGDQDQAGNPIHEVTLPAFRLGRYPVTVAEYRLFVEDDGYQNPRWWSAGGFGEVAAPEYWEQQQEHPTRPVVSVNWYEAAAYCAWCGGRLPTKAEWERAARGAERRRYPWGDEEPSKDRANFNRGPGHPTPVGLYPLGATPEGLQDMAGNVWEWCADWYHARQDDKNLRGGAWNYIPQFLRVSDRSRVVPAYRVVSIGFRCAGDGFFS